MLLYLKMLENINETMRHLKFHHISILANLLRTDKSSTIVVQSVLLLRLVRIEI